MKGDLAFLERVYHADYTFTSPEGQLSTRAQDLADMKSGALKAQSATVDDMKVRIYGGNTAVVTGRNTLEATYKGQDISGDYRFTDTFVKQGGQWLCVATHASRIMKQK